MMLIRVLFQTAFLALGQIWASKVRSLLTTLGIIIGVTAVIVVVALSGGAKRWLLTEFESFGAKKVFISGNVPRKMRGTPGIWPRVRLQLKEVEAIRDQASAIEMITPVMYGGYEIAKPGGLPQRVSVAGIWPSWHDIESRYVSRGRPFTAIDEQQALPVCLINDKAIEELDLPSNPLDEFILVGGRRFLVIGVVETKELPAMMPGGGEVQTEVYIPFSTARSLNPEGRINFALAQLISSDRAEEGKAEISFILRKGRGLRPGDPDTFDVGVVQQVIDQISRIAGGLTVFLAALVTISLLVGGIGIMNIMLVSVSERTREIGLRKAVGARPEVILLQFLVEAVVLCLVGGAVGLAIGYTMIIAIGFIPGFPFKEMAVPSWAIMLSVGFSAATGVVFGMFPAIKAARLNPIDALRHE